MTTFMVKLRDPATRSWGDQTELDAPSAQEAAETVAGVPLQAGPGVRAYLRARVWPAPFGSQPDIHFYVKAAGPAA